MIANLRSCILIVLCVFIAMPAAAQETDKILNIRTITSPKGITAWLVEDHTVPVIAMQFAFLGAGAAHDPLDKQGLAQLASNTMDEGADEWDSEAFQAALNDHSISLSFSAGRDDFTGRLKTLTREADLAYSLLHAAVTAPRFDEEPVERMRAANQSRLRSSLSDPDWIAARLMNDRAFGDHPYAKNSGGTLTTLANITPSDLHTFHKNMIGKNNLIVAVAGDITPGYLAAVLDQIFGELPDIAKPSAPPQVALQNTGKTAVFNMPIPQSVIAISQPGIDRNDPDYFAAQVMNFILGSSGFGSRLTQVVREERGLTYGIYSYFTNLESFAGLNVSTSTENKNAGTVITLVKDEWNKMKSETVGNDELSSTKSYLIGSLPLSLTSTDDIAALMLSLRQDGLPVNYLDTRQKAIEGVTAEDVKRVAERLLDTQAMTTVIVGQPEGIDNPDIITKLPNAE